MTTLVVASFPGGQSQGTAFYYDELRLPKDPKPERQWVQVKNTWIVTNRHVLLPTVAGAEVVPDTFTFHMRRIDGPLLRWEPVVLDRSAILSRARFHTDPEVDVAVLEVQDLLMAKLKEGSEKYARWHSVRRENFAGQNKISVEASDDVLVIGYPRAFYDEVNLFPIVKSGIVASRWGRNFNGKPYFLIDAKLFPGSSGSIVLSKPIDLVVQGGQVFQSDEKQFAFLGVYSGEPVKLDRPIELEGMVIREKSGFNVGVVWYAHLVDSIVREGKRYTP